MATTAEWGAFEWGEAEWGSIEDVAGPAAATPVVAHRLLSCGDPLSTACQEGWMPGS